MLLFEGSSETGHFRYLSHNAFGVHQLKNTSAITVIFSWKYSKLNLNFETEKKKWRKTFFWDNCIDTCCYKWSLLRREYLLSPVNGLKNSPKILHITQRDFIDFTELSSRGSLNMSFTFQQCFGPFAMLLAEGSFETKLFRNFPHHVFRILYVQKYISYEDHLFFQKVRNLL